MSEINVEPGQGAQGGLGQYVVLFTGCGVDTAYQRAERVESGCAQQADSWMVRVWLGMTVGLFVSGPLGPAT